jgi:hypothetical protein
VGGHAGRTQWLLVGNLVSPPRLTKLDPFLRALIWCRTR